MEHKISFALLKQNNFIYSVVHRNQFCFRKQGPQQRTKSDYCTKVNKGPKLGVAMFCFINYHDMHSTICKIVTF